MSYKVEDDLVTKSLESSTVLVDLPNNLGLTDQGEGFKD